VSHHRSLRPTQIAAALLRHGLAAVGFAGVLEGNSLLQAAGAIVIPVGLAWSVI
jgi:hypothetical protein